eukprot:PhF_6_TR34219/c0_g2_i5/m.50189
MEIEIQESSPTRSILWSLCGDVLEEMTTASTYYRTMPTEYDNEGEPVPITLSNLLRHLQRTSECSDDVLVHTIVLVDRWRNASGCNVTKENAHTLTVVAFLCAIHTTTPLFHSGRVTKKFPGLFRTNRSNNKRSGEEVISHLEDLFTRTLLNHTTNASPQNPPLPSTLVEPSVLVAVRSILHQRYLNLTQQQQQSTIVISKDDKLPSSSFLFSTSYDFSSNLYKNMEKKPSRLNHCRRKSSCHSSSKSSGLRLPTVITVQPTTNPFQGNTDDKPPQQQHHAIKVVGIGNYSVRKTGGLRLPHL